MSKEIAQTVSGPKIAWLLAIVAAFAVIATLGTQWQKSDAALLVGTPTISQAPAGTTIPAGGTVTFTASINVAASANAGTLQVNVPAGYTITGTATGGTEVGGTRGTSGATSGICTLGGTTTTAGTFTCTVTTTVPASTANGTVLPGATATATEGPNSATSAPTAGYTVQGTSGTVVPGVAGFTAGATFTLPIGITYCSDGTGGDARAFTAADGGGTAPGIVHVPTVAVDTVAGTHTATATGPGTITISTHASGQEAGVGCTTTTVTLTAAAFAVPELRHVDDNGDYIFGQEIANNVRGSRHTACFAAQDTAITVVGGADVPGVPVNVGTNFSTNFTNQPANAYNGPQPVIPQSPTANDVSRFISTSGNSSGASCVSWYSTGAGDQLLTASYVSTTDPSTAFDVRWNNAVVGTGLQGALVKEWNVLEDSVVSVVLWTPGTGSQTAQTSTQNLNAVPPVGSPLTINIPLFVNTATGNYDFNGAIFITDLFGGSHINSGGQLEDFPSPGLVGVNWTATIVDGDCGFVGGTLTGTTALDARDGDVDTISGDTFVTVGGPNINISDFDDCVFGDEIIIDIIGREGALGSGTGLEVRQRIIINFSIPAPGQKQVFLAWAGQRIILEHDWRIGPGDVDGDAEDGPEPVGFCPFDFGLNGSIPELVDSQVQAQQFGGPRFPVTYIKGSGPGNFLPGYNAILNGSDQATVFVQVDASQSFEDDNDIVGDANGSCISRVLFESEDQGQVDIEAFIDFNTFRQVAGQNIEGQFNVSKHAFVIYYMKLNTVDISLVTQAAKPTHNGVAGDWAGIGTTTSANPWNSSLDDADNAAEWNVSRDILVRGRVTGWFLTTNPSGRPADTSNPLNILPANRWVMPDDWAQLHGGPLDVNGLDDTEHRIGTAEEFRSYFDLLFAPNNTAGIALSTPEGNAAVIGATVATGNVGRGAAASAGPPATAVSPITVNSCVNLVAGTPLAVGSTSLGTVTSCAGTSLIVSSPLATAPAAGTLIFIVSGVPFEGPYSLLDIPGLAAQGRGGAALSNWDPGNIRDTILGDGDVDAWDAPMPPSMVSVRVRGTGFLKPVLKQDVYYLGTAGSAAQTYPNPYYITNIPDSPFIPAVVVGGGYLWNSWGNDGPGGSGDGVYRFWQWARTGVNSAGVGEALSAADVTELGIIASFHGPVARDAVVYSDNHGEFMFAVNGDFKTDLTACTTNTLAGGKHCAPGDKVGTAIITSTADYPDFRGKHFPVLSNSATVDWLWGGYKDVSVQPGETDQFKYIVFHAMDRDNFCTPPAGAISLHSVLTSVDAQTNFSGLGARYNGDPNENVDFLIDSGEGIIVGTSGGTTNDGRQFATGVPTFSVAANNPAVSGILEFPLSPLAADGQTDECQAWIRVSNSLLGVLNVLTIAHDDEGNIGFDRVIDLSNTMSYTLNFRWSLITWAGANGISVTDAITGTGTGGNNPGGNNISSSITAIYGWNASSQTWLAYFPSGVNVPGANDLTVLNTGQAYWVAITGPSSVTWTIATNIN